MYATEERPVEGRNGVLEAGLSSEVDEVHRFNKAQQHALLPSVEDGTLTLIGATTENPFFEVNGPLLSRSTLFRLEPLVAEALRELIRRSLEVEGAAIDDASAVEFVGLPEAQLNLAQAPKSNRVATAIWTAMEDVRSRPKGPVPAHLRDAHYKGATSIGHGRGYAYPHDDPRGWVSQCYRPDEVADRTYYEPSGHGFEAEVAARMAERS